MLFPKGKKKAAVLSAPGRVTQPRASTVVRDREVWLSTSVARVDRRFLTKLRHNDVREPTTKDECAIYEIRLRRKRRGFSQNQPADVAFRSHSPRRRAFTRALGVSSQEVEVFDSELANVVLFSATKRQ